MIPIPVITNRFSANINIFHLKLSPEKNKDPLIVSAGSRLSKNYRFSDNLCFDFAKHGRPKVPIRKLSPS